MLFQKEILIFSFVIAFLVIAFFIYIIYLKRRVSKYSTIFENAVDEFNSSCNPGHPMTDEAWAEYRSSHDDDFEHAHKVASSKLIALFVRDISNANTLVDIDDNHQAYLDDARVKNGYITTFEQAIEEAIEAKRATFDGLHYIAHSESLELEQKVKEASDAANLCIENNLLDYLTHAAECTELHEAIASLEDNRTSHNADFVKSELANCSDFFDHVLANPNNPDNQVTVDRPLTPQRPPAPNPTNQAEPTPPQPQQPRPRVGYVDTNSIQSTPKRQWPTEYPDGMPSWYKEISSRNNIK